MFDCMAFLGAGMKATSFETLGIEILQEAVKGVFSILEEHCARWSKLVS